MAGARDVKDGPNQLEAHTEEKLSPPSQYMQSDL